MERIMKLDPGFITHWKTERLMDELGADGVVALLRLWGRAQIRREWKGLKLTPKRLKMETKWKGDENHLFSIFTDPDAPWLDTALDGTYSIHDFEEHQKQVIHLWNAGGKGGRPRKVSLDSSKEEENPEKKEDSSSSSYPISEPNGNHMVSASPETRPLCTLQQALSQAPIARMTPEQAEHWWHTRNGSGWTKGSAGGGTARKITSWQSDMQTSLGWVAESMGKSQHGHNGVKKRQFAGMAEDLEMPDA
jgi:hypothetical protein